MIDVDDFKRFNDQFGHPAGDFALRKIAELLRKLARTTDIIARYGGEEFLLLLPGTVLDSAVTFAERLRQRVEEHKFAYEGGTLTRTMSCGVAAWPHPRITDSEAMLRAADEALYVAKELGRNRVVRFDSADFNAHTESPATADATTADATTASSTRKFTPGSPRSEVPSGAAEGSA